MVGIILTRPSPDPTDGAKENLMAKAGPLAGQNLTRLQGITDAKLRPLVDALRALDDAVGNLTARIEEIAHEIDRLKGQQR